MAYVLKVLVQMPDGTFRWLPVAHTRDGGIVVMTQDTEQEAWDWGRFILPDRVSVYPAP